MSEPVLRYSIYRVTMVVRDYVLLIVFFKFLYLAYLVCHFCPIGSCSSTIWQAESGRQWNNLIKANKT